MPCLFLILAADVISQVSSQRPLLSFRNVKSLRMRDQEFEGAIYFIGESTQMDDFDRP
jgi:hypothetical protein